MKERIYFATGRRRAMGRGALFVCLTTGAVHPSSRIVIRKDNHSKQNKVITPQITDSSPPSPSIQPAPSSYKDTRGKSPINKSNSQSVRPFTKTRERHVHVGKENGYTEAVGRGDGKRMVT